MKQFLALVAGITAMAASAADAQQLNVAGRRFSPEQVRSVAPALEKHTQERLYGAVWNRPGLNRKMRSVLNLGMLCALNKEHELKLHIRGALNNGLTKDEIKEVFLQVAIYCGVPAAVTAFRIAREVFKEG